MRELIWEDEFEDFLHLFPAHGMPLGVDDIFLGVIVKEILNGLTQQTMFQLA